MKKSIIIVGMGPGLSLGIAHKFGSEGYTIGMISRSVEKLESYKNDFKQAGIEAFYEVADVADTNALRTALQKLAHVLGGVDVLQYNAVDYRMKHIMEDNIDDLTNGFKTSVGNALEAVKELLPVLKKSNGSVLLTGGNSATNPNPDMGSISLGKAGIKNLAYQLNKVLATDGIYVGTLTISGWIQPDSQTHSPKILADKFWQMNSNRTDVEVVY